MDYSKEPYFEVEGVFYTYVDGPIAGYCYTHGESWHIIPKDDQDFYRDTVYLDREHKILAPRNTYQKRWSSKRINELIEEYQLKVDMLSSDTSYLRLDTFKMKLFMAKTYLIEYRSLKYSYFAENSLKFILF